MIYQTYACSMSNGKLEYGFTFKETEECDDCLFDVVLGCVDTNSLEKLSDLWARFEWIAKAIIADPQANKGY